MPRHNLTAILVCTVASLLCYERYEQVKRAPYTALFSQVMNLIEDKYFMPIDEKKERELFNGAMEGMLNRLDPHSAYFPPQEYPDFSAEIQQHFTGIGISVSIDTKTKRLKVNRAMHGQPAAKAGIRSGDLVMAIDGFDTQGKTLKEMIRRMKGKAGTKVVMTVLHHGSDVPVDITVVRGNIKTESVLGDHRRQNDVWDYLLEEDPRIGYIRLASFGMRTKDELAAVLPYKDHPIDALIMDLRYNRGGTLKGVVAICDMFIDEGLIVRVESRDPYSGPPAHYAKQSTTIVPRDIPIVILINRFSASASEIFAACLKDHRRAIIVGERSYGKGTVQSLLDMEGGRSCLKLTTGRYWRPNGKNIDRHLTPPNKEDEWGVSPSPGFEVVVEKEVALKLLQQRQLRDLPPQVRFSDNFKTKTKPIDDPQLRKAIDFLQKKIGKE